MSGGPKGLMRAACLVSVFTSVGAAKAEFCPGQEGGPASYSDLSVGYRLETLESDAPDWSDWNLTYAHTFAPRRLVIGRLTQSRRFSESDSSFSVGGYAPLGAKDTLFAETVQSGTHRVQPQSSYQLAWAHSFTQGWGAQIGGRYVRYDSQTSTEISIGELTLEKYISAFRIAYSYSPSHSTTAGNTDSHRAQLGYYYGQGSSMQILFAGGNEAEKPVTATSVVATRFRSAALFGLHAINCDWALGWGLSYVDNRGAVSTDREGFELYLRRRF